MDCQAYKKSLFSLRFLISTRHRFSKNVLVVALQPWQKLHQRFLCEFLRVCHLWYSYLEAIIFSVSLFTLKLWLIFWYNIEYIPSSTCEMIQFQWLTNAQSENNLPSCLERCCFLQFVHFLSSNNPSQNLFSWISPEALFIQPCSDVHLLVLGGVKRM